MSDRRRGLGRGLGALIPAAPQPAGSSPGSAPALVPDRGVAAAKVAGLVDRRPAEATPSVDIPVSRGTEPDLSSASKVPVSGAYFAELELDVITPNPRQPREVFDEDALNELVISIKEVGLLQPVVVRQIDTDRFELIMGERRWRACREAGLERIPAIVRATDDEKLLLDALLENLHRAQLNPLEEAAAYDQLLRDFSCTHEQLADRIGRSRSQVSNTLRLLKLSAPVQRRVAAGVHLLRARPRPALAGRRGRAGPAGAPDRRRGAVGARGRGDRHADEQRAEDGTQDGRPSGRTSGVARR